VRGGQQHHYATARHESTYVKTHIYHAFRKLGVNNRVQAVNWATQHAESLDRDFA
jgi:DNA-binding NarL/FixJ family response regulator